MAAAHAIGGWVESLKSVVLNPVVPGAALAFVNYAPPDVVAKVLTPAATAWLAEYLRITDVKFPLKVLLGLAIVRTVNRFVSRLALSNWTLSSPVAWNWPEEIVVVTGGSGGIGRDMVLNLVAKGVRVAVWDIAPLPADMAANGLIRHFHCDVSDPESVRAAADDVRATLGHPTILINNAGIVTSQSILDTPPAYLQKVAGVNLLSLWYTTAEFVPNMILHNKGHVVTIASAASYATLASAAHYSATKAGALAFTDCLRAELQGMHKATGVYATCVHPWWTTSAMTKRYEKEITSAMGAMQTSQSVADKVTKQVFSQRGGHVFCPDQTAAVVNLRSLPSWLQVIIGAAAAKMTVPEPSKKQA